MIPKEIKDKIEAYSKEKYPSLSDAKDEDGNYEVSEFEFNMQEGNQQEIHSAAEYGYTLRDDEVQSLKDEVERLKGLVEISETAFREILLSETDPKTAAGGALLCIGHTEPTKESIEWANKVIDKHKQQNNL